MKRKNLIIISCVALALFALFAAFIPMGERATYTRTVLDGVSITKSESSTSTEVSLQAIKPDGAWGFLTLQVDVSGDGTVKFEALCSLDDSTYLEPSAISDIATGITKTSGPGSDGADIYAIDLNGIAPTHLKIKATETGGSDSVTVTAILGVN